MKAGAAVTTPVGVGYTIGAAVPSDQRATGTRKMVSVSGTLSSRTTGEPGRLAPQYLSQNTRPKKPGARPWMRHTLVHNGLRGQPGPRSLCHIEAGRNPRSGTI